MGAKTGEQQEGLGAIEGVAKMLHENSSAMPVADSKGASRADVSIPLVQELSETDLLAQLVQLLGARERHRLLLSDLGALLPNQLRVSVKGQGGLRSWLHKHPGLFQVTGLPGKECVTLLIGMNSPAPITHERPDVWATVVDDADVEQLSSVDSVEAAVEQDAGDAALRKKATEEEESESTLQLRGLPFRATVQDIKNFLGSHASALKDDSSVEIVLNRDGRPSGFARVQLNSAAAAVAARQELHMQVMEVAAVGSAPGSVQPSDRQERYVEVFLQSERPSKQRCKRMSTSDSGSTDVPEEGIAPNATKEQVLAECREHMSSPGKHQVLLSMLGVALSPSARAFLKRNDLGLKGFISRYPKEFSIGGAKGRECITYLQANKGQTVDFARVLSLEQTTSQWHSGEEREGGPSGALLGREVAQQQCDDEAEVRHVQESSHVSIGDKSTGFADRHDEDVRPLPQSPKPVKFDCVHAGTPKVVATPSDWGTDWGTPNPYQASAPAQQAEDANGRRCCWLSSFPWQLPGWQPECGAQQQCLPPLMFGGPLARQNPLSGQNPGEAPPLPWANMLGPPLGAHAGDVFPGPVAPGGVAGATQPVAQVSVAGALSADKMSEASAPEETSTLRLRGLPFSATEQDVLAFFAKADIVDRIVEGPQAVKMMTKPNGKPLGTALVKMLTRADAEQAIKVLDGQHMGPRYIEVFLHAESEQAKKDKPASMVGPTEGKQQSHGGVGTNPATAPPAKELTKVRLADVVDVGGPPVGTMTHCQVASYAALFDFLKPVVLPHQHNVAPPLPWA